MTTMRSRTASSTSGPVVRRGKGPDASLPLATSRRAAAITAEPDTDDALWDDLARVIAAARQRRRSGGEAS
jgi:hypothetical protein